MSECIEWCGSKASGYGMVTLAGKSRSVHRLVFHLYHGYLPQVVRHKCDNRSCYNVEHLEGGTYKDNTRDWLTRGRYRDSVYSEYKLATFRLCSEDHKKLREIADHQGVSITGLIRQYIRKSHKRIEK